MDNKRASSNVQRAAELLLALGAAGPQGMSLSALAEVTDDAKSAVHRALIALSDFGFVEQSGRRGNYRLGAAIFALANRTPSIQEMVSVFRPALIAITAETGLSSFLMVRAGLDSVCIDFQTGMLNAQPFVDGVGGRLPLGVGLAGVCVLAMMEEAARERILDINAVRLQQWGVTPEIVRDEIIGFRREGYVRGVRRSMGIESLTLAVPAETPALFNCEAAVSLLAPVNGLSESGIALTIDRVRHHLGTTIEIHRNRNAI